MSTFSYLFRLNHEVTRQPKQALVLENVEMDIKDLWSALDQGVVLSIAFNEVGDCEEGRLHQQEYDELIASLTRRHFSFFLIGKVL